MKNKILMLMMVAQVALSVGVVAQNIAINTAGTAPNAAAILDLTNTANLGLLIPRTTALPTTLSVAAQGLLFYNTTSNVFNVNTSTTTTPTFFPLVTGPTTNTLTSSGNTLTSTVNSVSASPAATIVNTISNTSSANTLLTTVNGIAGATVPIINSNVLATSSANLTSTINGFASTALDLSPAITAVAWSLTGNANTTTSSFLGTTAQQDLIFKVFTTVAVEGMRISSLATTPGYVGVGTQTPASTLDITGTFATTVLKTNTLNNTASVWYINSGTTATFPSISATTPYTNRRYIISNRSGGSITTSSYVSLSTGTAGTTAVPSTIANGTAIEIISDGTSWLQIK